MKCAVYVIAAMLLVGCEKVVEDPKVTAARGQLRVELFEKCMKLVPPGPTTTQYNDWAEVISECRSTAFYQSNEMMP